MNTKTMRHYSPLEVKELGTIIQTTNKYTSERTEAVNAFMKRHSRPLAGVLFKMSTLSKRKRRTQQEMINSNVIKRQREPVDYKSEM